MVDRVYHGKTDKEMEAQSDADVATIEATGYKLERAFFGRGLLQGRELWAEYVAVHDSVFRGVSQADCLSQAQAEAGEARSRGWALVGETWADEAGVQVLTVSYKWSKQLANEKGVVATLLAPSPRSAKRGQGESSAHRLWNGLVQIWSLLLVGVIVVPIIAMSGSGDAGTGIGLAAGLTAAGVLFVPWVIVLVILLVLRSTTRSR
jgi:hypothetical protein